MYCLMSKWTDSKRDGFYLETVSNQTPETETPFDTAKFLEEKHGKNHDAIAMFWSGSKYMSHCVFQDDQHIRGCAEIFRLLYDWMQKDPWNSFMDNDTAEEIFKKYK